MSRPSHARGFKGGAKNIPAEPLVWLPYQSKIISDRSGAILIEKARRTGVTYCDGYKTAREHARVSNRLDTWISSRDNATAKLYAKNVSDFSRAFDKVAKFHGDQVLIDDGGRAHTVHEVRYADGSCAHSVAGNADVFAGKGGNIKLDEIALRRDPQAVYDIASPVTDWGGTKTLISTHRGNKNFFNKLVREIREGDNPKRFSYHRITLEDALEQNLLWKLQTVWGENDERMEFDEADYWNYLKDRCGTPEAFMQEYCCVPEDDSTAFITYEMITGAQYPEGYRWETALSEVEAAARNGSEFYGGLDIARSQHLTVFTLLEKVSARRFETRALIPLHNMRFSDQERILWPWFAACRRTCIDDTGLGMQFAERAEERHGRNKIEAVRFSAPVKEELAYPVRAALEDGALGLPYDDRITEDFRMVKKETTLAGNIRFVADSEDADDGSHADRFWAYALALHAAKKNVEIPLPKRHAGGGRTARPGRAFEKRRNKKQPAAARTR